MKKMNKAVFFDRDGTLIRDTHYISSPAEIAFYRSSFAAIRLLKKAGYKLIIITNQSGIARGYFSREQLARIHGKMNRILKEHHAAVDGLYFCPHLPARKCSCRKPAIGMIKKARKDFNLDLKNSFFIGDKRTDIHCAHNFGGTAVLVLSGKGRKERPLFRRRKPRHVSPTLYDAARWIIRVVEG